MNRHRRPGPVATFLIILAAAAAPTGAPRHGAPEAAIGGPARSDSPGWSRVQLDRLRWSPDGSALAVEARLERPGDSSVDTLLIDLNRGGRYGRSPRPLAFALSADRSLLGVATRYALLAGPAAHPESLSVLINVNPAEQEISRLAFNPTGDTLLVLSRRGGGRYHEIAGLSLARGREIVITRYDDAGSIERAWHALRRAPEPLPVLATPFPTLYQPVGSSLLFIQRSEMEVPGGKGRWLFDLHRLDRKTGTEWIMVRFVAPWGAAVAADSSWVAIAGEAARPDFGGRVDPCLWVQSADGSKFFTVLPEGFRGDHAEAVTGLCWAGRELWYTTPGGLFHLDPRRGRSRGVPIGPPAAEWSAVLPGATEVATLLYPREYGDSLGPVIERERLRQKGWLAWVDSSPSRGYRVAVGAETDGDRLAPLSAEMTRAGEAGFTAATLPATAGGDPFAYAVVRCPTDFREAYLRNVGAPGRTATELWLSERQGARQIRLLPAMMGPATR